MGVGIWLGMAMVATAAAEERPRVLVLTDISSLKAGEAEPDDGQSLIRFLLHANEMDVEGFVASSNLGHGQRVRPDLILEAIDAYERVLSNLKRHDARYPEAEALRAMVRGGQPEAGPKVALDESVGAGKRTPGSDWILKCADREDSRPLHILIWGGSADLAQAIWDARADRTAEELNALCQRLRVHAINDQDSTGRWIKENFPEMPYLTQERAYRGMYRGGDVSLVDSEWVERHIAGHGALGDLYPNYRGGDIFGRTHGPVRGIKEGDTPSFLAILPFGLTVPGRSDLGSWGGRFRESAPNRWMDVTDGTKPDPTDPDPRMVSVSKWRPAYQAEFEARLDWCVKPYDEANHAPVVHMNGDLRREMGPGEMIELDASGSSDPDGDGLRFRWEVYPDVDVLGPVARIEGADSASARLRVEAGAAGREIPVLLTVTDDGEPALSRYARVLVKVAEGSGAP